MWKPFCNSGNLYMLRLEEGENTFNLLLTDLSCVWECQFSSLNLVEKFKENNPLIGATDQQITSDLLEIIQSLQNVDISIKTTSNNVELVLAKDLDDTIKKQKILYKFTLNKQEDDEFKNKITIPAIQTIYFLEKQQKTLLNLIKKKDRELEEYKMEKGDISRGDLKTDKFESNILNTENQELLLNVFTRESSKHFWQIFTEKNGEVQATNLHVELEPWNTKPKKRVIHSGKRVVKKGSGVVFKK